MIDVATPPWPGAAAPHARALRGPTLRLAPADWRRRWREHWPRALGAALVVCAAWPLAGRGAFGPARAGLAVHDRIALANAAASTVAGTDTPAGATANATTRATQGASGDAAAEWPTRLDGEPLRPLALGAVEQRFARRFPGRIGRFAAESGNVWVLRDVMRPTRALHPAADCFRGLGYRLEPAQLQREARVPTRRIDATRPPADAPLWRCFVAERNGERLRVCERIVDAQGQAFVDASSWFWAATLGRSRGPWRALTRVEAL